MSALLDCNHRPIMSALSLRGRYYCIADWVVYVGVIKCNLRSFAVVKHCRINQITVIRTTALEN